MITPLVVTAVVLWASTFVGIRAALVDFSPIEIVVFRFVISSITLLGMAIFQKVKLPPKKDLFLFAIMGLVLFINNITLNYGTQTITAGETTLILSTSQLFQVLLAYLFLNETISNRFLLGLFICFIGVAVIAFQNSTGFSANLGVVLVLCAAITNAVYFIMQKPLLKNYYPLEVISFSNWTTTFLLLPFGSGVMDRILVADKKSTAAVIFIGVGVIIASLCWSKLLSRIDASKAAIYLYIIPVMTILIGYIWLRELPSPIACLGGVAIIGGVVVGNRVSNNHPLVRGS
jgi:drug/metabolite transporter (DMT)-like permease